MNYPKLCVVDTNVAKTANLSIQPDDQADVPDECIAACVEAIKHVTEKKGVILDAGD